MFDYDVQLTITHKAVSPWDFTRPKAKSNHEAVPSSGISPIGLHNYGFLLLYRRLTPNDNEN